MPTPYRRPALPDDDREEAKAERWDDRLLGSLLLLVGGFRVVLALATGEPFGAEASIAAVATALGFLIIASTIGRR
ncbi:MAG: hypothetical protein ACTHU0_23505 [Kofleriaceae bacterium]